MLNVLVKQFKCQFRHYKVIYIVLALYSIAYFPITFFSGVYPRFEIGFMFLWICAVIFVFFCSLTVMVKIIRIMFSESPARPARQLIEWSRFHIKKHNRLGNSLHGVIIFGIAIFIFSTVKSAIPALNPFSWDEYFMLMDRDIFFGVDPWILLKDVLGEPHVTSAISLLYSNLWMIVVASVVTYSFVAGDDYRRVQFTLSCVLTWIVSGNILAIAFSSAGPCYYGFFVDGVDPYARLMEYLAEVDAQTGAVVSLQVQELLWTIFVDSEGQVSGISAMPSLHIMFCLLVAFYVYDINRVLGLFLYFYAIIVCIGSVYLGWHYAVDGIAAIVLAVATWFASGWVLRRAGYRRADDADAVA